MARQKEYKVEFANPKTVEKMGIIKTQYPDKSTQDILDIAVDLLFRQEYERIQNRLNGLMGIKPENVD